MEYFRFTSYMKASKDTAEAIATRVTSVEHQEVTSIPPQEHKVSPDETSLNFGLQEGEHNGERRLVKRTSFWTIWSFKSTKGNTAKEPKVVSVSRAQKRANKSALALRAVILGPNPADAPKVTRAVAKPQLSKIKAQLMQPKQAKKVISALHKLPASGDFVEDHAHCAQHPIHAVCLSHTDAEEDALHFTKLSKEDTIRIASSVSDVSPPQSSALDRIAAAFNDVHVIDLVKPKDLGLGQPASSPGLLAGALPTPGTVIEGVKQITPELMALGYATGHLLQPDHSGIYPPTDRMSVLTYWWGLEILLPPPSIEYLSNVQSVTSTVMNFLSALSLVNNGVRELLPFVRYFAQFIDFEFNSIKKVDKGNGVVCAATWIMPAAMIPRAWDFPLPPDPNTPPPVDPSSKTAASKVVAVLEEARSGEEVTIAST